MDYSLYRNSLGLALTLMLFFAVYFLTAKTPEKPIFKNYILSRHLIAVALLLLSANYVVHLCYGLRFSDAHAAILMNLSTYYLAYFVFSVAFITLLNRNMLTLKRQIYNLASWVLYVSMSIVILKVLPSGKYEVAGMIFMTIWVLAYGTYRSSLIIRNYKRAVHYFDETHSENLSAYIRWMYIFTWWAVVYGVSCGLFTYLPNRYIYLWILSSVPFYVYLFYSYMNYLLFYEKVEGLLENTTQEEIDKYSGEGVGQTDYHQEDVPSYQVAIEKNLKQWLSGNGFTSPGLTLEDLALSIGTNRTYLSTYINSTFGMSFREWIAGLRIEYAKKMLLADPKMTVAEVSEATGFLSQSYFIRLFTDKESLSPSKWKKQNNSACKK